MKIRPVLTAIILGASLNISLAATAANPAAGEDPFLWLEQAHRERAM